MERSPGNSVLAGTIVETGAVDVRTEKVGADTTFARIVGLVEQTESEQAPVQKLTDRVATWLLPAVAVLLLTVFLNTDDVRKIVTLLIFTSAAELGLATPMVMLARGGESRAVRHLRKGGLYLEQLAKVDVAVFDKTGTLTVGEPRTACVIGYGSRIFSRACAGVRTCSVRDLANRIRTRVSLPVAGTVISPGTGNRGVVPSDNQPILLPEA